MKAVIYFIATLFALCSSFTQAALLNIVPETVEAQAWTVFDSQSGQVIAEHNSHVQRAPASLTKMMVAYIALLCTRQISQNPYPIRVLPS